MTDFKNTPELSESTETAISYSTCYQQCFLSDNMELMKTIESNTIDLIYCDILYGTGRKFKNYQDLKPMISEIENHYLPRLKEMHRVLKSTGSIYLQMDTRINHWMRCIMDDIFNYSNFRTEIAWCYAGGGIPKNNYPKKHDVILFYSKTEKYYFNHQLRNYSKSGSGRRSNGDKYDLQGQTPINDWWIDIAPQNTQSKDKVDYNTQKPKALLERIINASSNEGDLVADFYAGSFTTAVVCKELNRNFIGCDINPLALEISKQRLA